MSAAVKDLDAFRKKAGEQQARIDWLLAIRRRFGIPPTREAAGRAKVEWTAEISDPEFQKNLRIFRRLIRDAVAICERKQTSDAPTLDEPLGELITLPSDRPLTLKALLGLQFVLEQRGSFVFGRHPAAAAGQEFGIGAGDRSGLARGPAVDDERSSGGAPAGAAARTRAAEREGP